MPTLVPARWVDGDPRVGWAQVPWSAGSGGSGEDPYALLQSWEVQGQAMGGGGRAACVEDALTPHSPGLLVMVFSPTWLGAGGNGERELPLGGPVVPVTLRNGRRPGPCSCQGKESCRAAARPPGAAREGSKGGSPRRGGLCKTPPALPPQETV